MENGTSLPCIHNPSPLHSLCAEPTLVSAVRFKEEGYPSDPHRLIRLRNRPPSPVHEDLPSPPETLPANSGLWTRRSTLSPLSWRRSHLLSSLPVRLDCYFGSQHVLHDEPRITMRRLGNSLLTPIRWTAWSGFVLLAAQGFFGCQVDEPERSSREALVEGIYWSSDSSIQARYDSTAKTLVLTLYPAGTSDTLSLEDEVWLPGCAHGNENQCEFQTYRLEPDTLRLGELAIPNPRVGPSGYPYDLRRGVSSPLYQATLMIVTEVPQDYSSPEEGFMAPADRGPFLQLLGLPVLP